MSAHHLFRSAAKGALPAALAGALLLAGTAAQARSAPESFAPLVKQVSPSVVFVATERQGNAEAQRLPFPEGSPFEEFFERFGNPNAPEGQQPRPQRGVGSGFIIDDEGFIVTNHHVVEGADEIEITLEDGDIYQAELIGTDPQTDLAVLKIEPRGDLAVLDFGDSDAVEVGDWVMAVGNPFGLGGSVTAGIVSARSRNINAGPYDDFIQTDAAINRGNSGGPMFNLDGEVIGINTAIFSPSGGSIGIGFAIPSNLARPIIAQLQEGGTVERGWLGVMVQQVTPELAEAVGLDGPRGALVANVVPGGPADAAGLEQGDVIVSFADSEIEEMRDLPRIVAGTEIGQGVDVQIWRNGAEERFQVEIGRLQPEQAALEPEPQDTPDASASESLGADLVALDPEMRQRFDLPGDAQGVVIVEVQGDGPAAEAGLRPGDVIRRVDGEQIETPGQVSDALSEAASGQRSALILVERDGNPLFVGVKPRV
ncbi:DegQ family serine endoprotease [Algihabitans albus]|uniref:DegQ family serine endoprotease n=1 Tax=Algihabitans albus TaxID=2164067 RepID=UPI000E5C831D|nr:DegQ family serine endoprotease [Algihabitans albus]